MGPRPELINTSKTRPIQPKRPGLTHPWITLSTLKLDQHYQFKEQQDQDQCKCHYWNLIDFLMERTWPPDLKLRRNIINDFSFVACHEWLPNIYI